MFFKLLKKNVPYRGLSISTLLPLNYFLFYYELKMIEGVFKEMQASKVKKTTHSIIQCYGF